MNHILAQPVVTATAVVIVPDEDVEATEEEQDNN
jgi:hypothetical protein